VSRFISKTIEITCHNDGNEATWAVLRDTVNQVLQEAQRPRGERNPSAGKPVSGDLRIRLQYNHNYLRDEILVTWDEVS
jgi:hypothetical protein